MPTKITIAPPPLDEARQKVDNSLHGRIVTSLKKVNDPEIPINIYDLGLIYRIDADEKTGKTEVKMTLTAPNCPVADQIVKDVETAVRHVNGVTKAVIKLVFSPPWGKDKLTEDGRAEMEVLGLL